MPNPPFQKGYKKRLASGNTLDRSNLSREAVQAHGESGFAKALHAVQTPLYITAGVVDEYLKREKGRRPTPYSRILKESGANLLPWISDERRRVTYGTFIDNAPAALAMDILGDPVTYIPYAGATKVVKGLGIVGKVALKTPLKATIRKADKILGTGMLKRSEDAADAVRRIYTKDYDLKKLGGSELLDIKENQYRMAGTKMRELSREIEGEIGKLVPDYAGQAKIYDLIERRPVLPKGIRVQSDRIKSMSDNPEFLQWRKELDELSPNELMAYKSGIRIQGLLEDIKIESGLLSEGAAEGFRKKFGIQYLPHMRATREHFIGVGEDFLGAIRAGDETALLRAKTYKLPDGRIAGDIPDGIKRVEKALMDSIDDARNAQEIDPAIVDKIRKEAGFLSPRYRPGSARELEDVRMDLAAVLGLESAQVAQAYAAAKHAEALITFTKNKQWVFDERPLMKELAERFGKKEAAKLMRGGFIDVSELRIKGLSGYVPKAVAGELKRVHKAYTSTAEMDSFIKKYKKVQDIWKAWTLSIFPAYHSRNAVSNLWNNFLAGMGPTATKHYHTANHLLWKYKRGTLSPSESKVIDEALRVRVLDEGWYRGEVGHLFEGTAKPAQVITKMYHPAHNPALKTGFAIGRHIEDHARLAHFLWAKNSKGMSVDDAAKSVNKYLFDYRYGLSPTEKKFGRDLAFPFIAWTRFNLPLQLEMMVAKPGRFLTMPKTVRAIEQYQEAHNDGYGAPPLSDYFMADWMKRATKLKLRYNPEKESYEYFILDQWLPSADVGKLFDRTAFRDMVTGLLSPGVKLPIEILFNYNLFQKRKIREYKGQKENLLGVKMAPELEHAARSIRLLNEADRIIEGTLKKDGDMSGWAAFIRGITGKAYPYKPEQQQKRWVWDMNKRISKLKYLRKLNEKRGNDTEAGVIEGIIEELESERDYFKKIKVN